MGMIWKIRMAVFPFEKILCKPPLLFTSKRTADVNPCFPLPEPLTSQELPRAHPQTAGVPRSQKPRPLWWRSSGTGHLPHCWIRCFLLRHEGVVSPPAQEAETPPPTLPASKGCGVSSLSGRAKFVADKLLSCQKVVAKDEEAREPISPKRLPPSVNHNVKLWLHTFPHLSQSHVTSAFMDTQREKNASFVFYTGAIHSFCIALPKRIMHDCIDEWHLNHLSTNNNNQSLIQTVNWSI